MLSVFFFVFFLFALTILNCYGLREANMQRGRESEEGGREWGIRLFNSLSDDPRSRAYHLYLYVFSSLSFPFKRQKKEDRNGLHHHSKKK